jgi:hypothetical protein
MCPALPGCPFVQERQAGRIEPLFEYAATVLMQREW